MSDVELKSNEEWKAWGKEDPMYGVSSWDNRDKDGSNPWTTEEFYEMGRLDWASFFKVWNANFNVIPGTAVEIGAGAGRMTAQISGTFASVKALDVSEPMLDFAKQNVKAPNIDWLVTNGLEYPVESGTVDGVFSCHVFQHFDNYDAVVNNFKECARVLKPGGSICIHLPVHSFPEVSESFSRLAARLYRNFQKVQKIKADRWRRRWRQGKDKPYMHGQSIERDTLLGLIESVGLCDAMIVTLIPHGGNGNSHSLILAAKPAA